MPPKWSDGREYMRGDYFKQRMEARNKLVENLMRTEADDWRDLCAEMFDQLNTTAVMFHEPTDGHRFFEVFVKAGRALGRIL